MATNKVPYLGLEGLQEAAARKRKIADLLATQSQQQGDFRSVFQPLGQIAQAIASKRAGKKATELQTQIGTEVANRRQASGANFAQQTGMDPTMVAALTDPNIPDALVKAATNFGTPTNMRGPDGKPVLTVANSLGQIKPASGGFSQPKMENINGQFVDMNSVQSGQNAPIDPSAIGWHGPNGTIVPNPIAMAGQVARGGGGAAATTVSPVMDPNAAPQQAPQGQRPPGNLDIEMLQKHPQAASAFDQKFGAGASQQYLQSAPQPSGHFATPQQLQMLEKALGPQGAQAYLQKHGIKVGGQ